MELIAIGVLLVTGFGVGRYLERKHYANIQKREKQLLAKPAITAKYLDPDREVATVALAFGSVVISVDYYKRFLAGLRLFFGGELTSYSSLIDRARREALLRMKESIPDADLFINCRLETSSLSRGASKTLGSAEVVAYGTAIRFAPGSPAAQ